MQYPFPPDQTRYYEQVWELARQVPYAKVTTYGQLARMIDCPPGVDEKAYEKLGSRWMGTAMAACPDDVPWHRVINAKGEISARTGARDQLQRLKKEGVVFAHDKIDLTVYLWPRSDPASGPAQGDLF